MTPRTLEELRAKVLVKVQEEASTVFANSDIDDAINDASQEIADYHEWERVRKVKTLISNYYTTVSSSSSGSTVHATSVAGLRVGNEIWLTDGSSTYEKVTVTAISGTDITVSPSLVNTFASGAYIVGAHLYLPYDCENIKQLKVIDIQTTGQDAEVTLNENQYLFDEVYPYIKSMGRPTHHSPVELDETAESLTIDAGTTTTLVRDSALIGHEANYYVGYLWSNIARKRTARVTASIITPNKDLTVSPAITGQVAGDTGILTVSKERVRLYPIPDKVYTFDLTYIKEAQQLTNDYDRFQFYFLQRTLENAIIFWAAGELVESDEQMERGANLKQKAYDKMKLAKGKNRIPGRRQIRLARDKMIKGEV